MAKKTASPTNPKKLKIFIVDDHPIFREGVYAERVLRAGGRGYV